MPFRTVVNVITGEVEEVPLTPEEIASAEQEANRPPKTRIYKADIWRRCNDQEAAAIDALLNAQPVRLRRMWNDTTFLSTTDDLFPLIHAAAIQLFGAERAEELLEPTE